MNLLKLKFAKIASGFINNYLDKEYPSSLKIEVTSRCNLKCITCLNSHFKRPNTDMSFENFKNFVDNYSNLKLVDFTGFGENFLNKDFMKMVRYAKSKNISVEMASSFYFVDKSVAEELIETGVDKICISIDGATKETYEKIRIGSDFDKVVDNINNFFVILEKKKIKPISVYFNYVVNRYNVKEMVDFVQMVDFLRNRQRTAISFSPMFSVAFYKINKNLQILSDSEIIKKYVQEAIKKGKELGIPVIYNQKSSQAPIRKCTNYLRPFIFVTGEVLPCCVAIKSNYELKMMLLRDSSFSKNEEKIFVEKIKKILKEISLGNIFEKNFKEIWQSAEYKKFRKELRQGKIPIFCENCPLYKK